MIRAPRPLLCLVALSLSCAACAAPSPAAPAPSGSHPAAAPPQAAASTRGAPGPEVRKYLRVSTPRVILEHVEIIDGTGAPPRFDQNVEIADGTIRAITAGSDQPPAADTTILDLRGDAVLPGIVGMHGHLFYLARPNPGADGSFDPPALFLPMSFSAPRLYLANGVTTMRTAGSAEPYTDLKLRSAIERGVLPGPHLDVTGPYLDGLDNPNLQMPALTGPDDARQTVAFWADRGVTSFKAYAHITRAELGAAIDEAHRRGLKVTGHLCSVTYEEAVELGIDNLEHGFGANTQLDPGKQPDTCSASGGDATLVRMAAGSPEVQRLFALLLQHHVAITSTLPNPASSVAGQPPPPAAALAAMSPQARQAYLDGQRRASTRANAAELLRRDMELQRAFVAAGGLLIAGADPVGLRGVIPGFGDLREIELLVEAGFSPMEAIRIATLNGASFLGRQDSIGSIAVGKHADLVIVKGDPAARIADIENIDIVFQDGLGYDRNKLLDAVAGHYGEY